MEYVKCEDCKCWDKEHWLIKDDKRYDGKFAVCNRHAPAMNPGALKQTTKYIFKEGEDEGSRDAMYISQTQRGVPSTRYDEGCWEGVSK